MTAQTAAQTARTAGLGTADVVQYAKDDCAESCAVRNSVSAGSERSSIDRALKAALPRIVQACNAHDDLVAALKALVEPPLRYNGDRIEIDCDSHATAMKLVATARAALAKAGAL